MEDEHKITQTVIRVYGILMDEKKRILVSDEIIRGKFYTKFPGGGLELGEGLKDCLIREFKEETNLDIDVVKHIYTTDFFQQSAFDSSHQIISIYYLVAAKDASKLSIKNKIFDFTEEQLRDLSKQAEVFRWIAWNDLHEDCVSLPIDKIVVNLLKEDF